MQITRTMLRMGSLSLGMMTLGVLVSGCQAKNELASVPLPTSPEGLTILLSEVNDRVAISFANTGEKDVVIYRQLLPSGVKPELAFEFNGIVPGLETAPHRGQLEVNENPNATITVPAEKVTGILFFKDDLGPFFSLKQGECYRTRVFYRSTLEESGAFKGELASNPVQICF